MEDSDIQWRRPRQGQKAVLLDAMLSPRSLVLRVSLKSVFPLPNPLPLLLCIFNSKQLLMTSLNNYSMNTSENGTMEQNGKGQKYHRWPYCFGGLSEIPLCHRPHCRSHDCSGMFGPLVSTSTECGAVFVKPGRTAQSNVKDFLTLAKSFGIHTIDGDSN